MVTDGDQPMEGAQLIVTATATYKATVGYGDLYDCEIRRVLAGELDQERIELSILAGDQESQALLSSHPGPAEIEIAFRLNRTDEPYARAPISGFVDDARTSWEIVSVRPA